MQVLLWIKNHPAHSKLMSSTAFHQLYYFTYRPMYLDGTDDRIPDGDNAIAVLMRAWLEPLLKVDIPPRVLL